jgi:hypothetical protein
MDFGVSRGQLNTIRPIRAIVVGAFAEGSADLHSESTRSQAR